MSPRMQVILDRRGRQDPDSELALFEIGLREAIKHFMRRRPASTRRTTPRRQAR